MINTNNLILYCVLLLQIGLTSCIQDEQEVLLNFLNQCSSEEIALYKNFSISKRDIIVEDGKLMRGRVQLNMASRDESCLIFMKESQLDLGETRQECLHKLNLVIGESLEHTDEISNHLSSLIDTFIKLDVKKIRGLPDLGDFVVVTLKGNFSLVYKEPNANIIAKPWQHFFATHNSFSSAHSNWYVLENNSFVSKN